MDGPEVELDEMPEELKEDPAFVDIFDERAQANSDTEQLVNAMKTIRQQLSVAKINLRMAQRGLLTGEGIHPEQIKKDIRRTEEAIAQIKDLWQSMGPEGFSAGMLDTYAAVPPEASLTEAGKIT